MRRGRAISSAFSCLILPTMKKRRSGRAFASRGLFHATLRGGPPRIFSAFPSGSASRPCLYLDESVLQEATKSTSVRELFAKRTDDPGGWFAGDVVDPPRVRFPDGHAPRVWREAAFYSCYSRRCIHRREGGCQGVPTSSFFSPFPLSLSVFLSFPLPFFLSSFSPFFLPSSYFTPRYTFFFSLSFLLPGHSARPTVRQRSNTRASFDLDPVYVYRATLAHRRIFLIASLRMEAREEESGGKKNVR